MATVANRKSDAARLPVRLVRDDKTLPPDILLLGARQSLELKCFALGHAERSSPHSGHKLEREIGPNAVYPGQIFSKQAMKCFANIEGEPIRLSAFAPWRARAICPNILVPSNRTESLENRLNLDVTGRNLLLIHIIERQRLFQYKQMF